jgi:hypothetical protein
LASSPDFLASPPDFLVFASSSLAFLTLAKRDRREIQNRLRVLGAHLLKRRYQPEKATPSWDATILEQSARIRGVLDDSPSLVREVGGFILRAYPDARKLASAQTKKPLEGFPERPSSGFVFQWCEELGLEIDGYTVEGKAGPFPSMGPVLDEQITTLSVTRRRESAGS